MSSLSRFAKRSVRADIRLFSFAEKVNIVPLYASAAAGSMPQASGASLSRCHSSSSSNPGRIARKIIHMEEKKIKMSGVSLGASHCASAIGKSGLTTAAATAAAASTFVAPNLGNSGLTSTVHHCLTETVSNTINQVPDLSVQVELVSLLSLTNSSRRHDPSQFLCDVFGALARHGVNTDSASTAVSNIAVTLPKDDSLCTDRFEALQRDLVTLEVRSECTQMAKIHVNSLRHSRHELSALIFGVFSEHDISAHHILVCEDKTTSSKMQSIIIMVPEAELDFVLDKLNGRF